MKSFWENIPAIDILVGELLPGDVIFNSKHNGIFIHAITPMNGEHVLIHCFLMQSQRSDVFTWLKTIEVNAKILRDGEFLAIPK